MNGDKPLIRPVVMKVIDSLVEGSLEVKLPTIWTVEKQR